ncbi:hypothetical protein [Actinomadura rupiterrae]|uniref:hypothetical protein n=1 Tax=Actinomadura rupiterrae TaxID=559627 RepID=UPI0020A4ACCE|nr:hypothetical protein [Actinomadura rupiterrae]MCP2337180.1 hypothetical protein [Actinomadura rupiterrae]
MTLSSRTTRGALFAAGATAALLAAAGPALASTVQYCGAGRGPTRDIAVQAAIDDAKDSARDEGHGNCVLAGDPHVDEVFNDPTFGHVFFASATLNCT